MKTRDIVSDDLQTINNIYKDAGFGYDMPNLNAPLFVVKKAVEDDNGKVIGFSVCKITAEVYLFLDQKNEPEVKVEAMKELNDEISKASYEIGLDQITCWIPPEIEKQFSKRLLQMEWIKSRWPTWTRNLVEG